MTTICRVSSLLLLTRFLRTILRTEEEEEEGEAREPTQSEEEEEEEEDSAPAVWTSAWTPAPRRAGSSRSVWPSVRRGVGEGEGAGGEGRGKVEVATERGPREGAERARVEGAGEGEGRAGQGRAGGRRQAVGGKDEIPLVLQSKINQ